MKLTGSLTFWIFLQSCVDCTDPSEQIASSTTIQVSTGNLGTDTARTKLPNDKVPQRELKLGLSTITISEETKTVKPNTATPKDTTTETQSEYNVTIKETTTAWTVTTHGETATQSARITTRRDTATSEDKSSTKAKIRPPLTAPMSFAFASTKNKEESSTTASMAITNGKTADIEIDGKNPCYIKASLVCVEELKCHGSGEIDCSSAQQDYKDEYYYDDDKSATVAPITTPELSQNVTLKAYLNFNRRRKKIHHTTKPGRTKFEGQEDDNEEDDKPCPTTGDVQCLPIPTYEICKGKSVCGDPQKEEDRGLEDWEIAVISVLTLLGVILLAALIYVLYTSWKKKKVRPAAAAPTVHHIMGRRVRAT